MSVCQPMWQSCHGSVCRLKNLSVGTLTGQIWPNGQQVHPHRLNNQTKQFKI